MNVHRMTTSTRRAVALSLWLSLGAAASEGLSAPQASLTPESVMQPDRQRDLSGYDSFAWNRAQEPAEDLATHLRLINAIQDRMKKQGLRIDTIQPKTRIRYRYEVIRGVETQSDQQRSVWDPTDVRVKVNVRRQRRIRLQIELTEEGSGFLLWRAEGTYPMATPDRLPRQLQEVVAGLFDEWPDDEETENER